MVIPGLPIGVVGPWRAFRLLVLAVQRGKLVGHAIATVAAADALVLVALLFCAFGGRRGPLMVLWILGSFLLLLIEQSANKKNDIKSTLQYCTLRDICLCQACLFLPLFFRGELCHHFYVWRLV